MGRFIVPFSFAVRHQSEALADHRILNTRTAAPPVLVLLDGPRGLCTKSDQDCAVRPEIRQRLAVQSGRENFPD